MKPGVRLYVSVGCAVAVLLSMEAWIQSQPVLEEMRTDLSSLESRQLDTYLENTKLLTTLATALIGAASGLLLNRDARVALGRTDRRRIVFSWTLAALSIYAGHLAHQNVVWMLHSHFFNLFYPGIAWPTRAQFWLFLMSVVVLADFLYRSLHQEASQ